MRWMLFAALSWLCSPLLAMDKTVIIEMAQSWHQGSSQSSRLTARMDLSTALADNIRLTSKIRGQIFGPDELEPGEPDQQAVSPASKRRYPGSDVELELRQFYIDVGFKRSSLRIGKQQVVWGQADGLKLLDLVNPQDFRQFILAEFNESRIPLWMINVELFLPNGDLQLLWVPDTSMHNLAESGALFAFTAPFVNISTDIQIHFEGIDRPDNVIKDSDFGLRFSMFAHNWDLTFNYLYHYDDFPVLRQSINATGLRIRPEYERTHSLGASASNAFGSFIFRSEIVVNSHKYQSSVLTAQNKGVDDTPEVAYMVGLDWQGISKLFFSLQIFQSHLLADKDFNRDRVDSNLTLLARRQFMNERLRVEFLIIAHLNDGDKLIRLKSEFEMLSNTVISVYGDYFSGSSDELFGQFRHRNQVGVKLLLAF
ncbi:MAG: hypothetical protein KUG79_10160 [Pseudomonadales bacterium]|nr:hypothetical protein [Pseudomonadales bacterium]